MAEEVVETQHPGVLLYAKCHTDYAGGSDKLLELAEGDVVAVVEEKAETGWCVRRLRLKTGIAPAENARCSVPAGTLDSCCVTKTASRGGSLRVMCARYVQKHTLYCPITSPASKQDGRSTPT